MIKASFTKKDGLITGFRISGHSGAAPSGSDIVCAAVSSAAYMAANTVTEVMKLDADVSERDGLLELELAGPAEKARDVMEGLLLHLTDLASQYPDRIKITVMEE